MKSTLKKSSLRALVVGATGAIGQEIVKELRVRGYQVAGWGRRNLNNDLTGKNGSSKIENTCLNVAEKNLDIYQQVDLQDPKQIEDSLNALDDFGKIDLLVVASGLSEPSLLAQNEVESLQRSWQVNVNSGFLLVKKFWKKAVRGGGMQFIWIGSAVTELVTKNCPLVPGIGAYAAAKMALLGLNAQINSEGAKYAITSRVIPIPVVDTPMTREIPPIARKKILESNSQHHPISPKEAAQLVIANI